MLINILLILAVLGVLIFIHELGHFLAAKLSGVRVDAFAIGMGPALLRRKIGETEYCLNLLPIGGYVKIYGEGDDPEDIDPKIASDPRAYTNKSIPKKVFILTAGVLMNFLTAVVIYYTFLFMTDFRFLAPDGVAGFDPWFGEQKTEIAAVLKYSELSEDGNAKKAGWPESGYIGRIGLDKESLQVIQTSKEFADFVRANPGKQITVEVCPDEARLECQPYTADVSTEGRVGIVLPQNFLNIIEYRAGERFLGGFVHSVNMVQLAGVHISNIFSEASDSGNYDTAINTVSSPIGLYFAVDFIKQSGVLGILDLIANLSLTLFIMNLLPIPALDGGRVILVLAEGLIGERFSKNIQLWLIRFSYIFLMIFMLAIFVKDIVYFDKLRELFG